MLRLCRGGVDGRAFPLPRERGVYRVGGRRSLGGGSRLRLARNDGARGDGVVLRAADVVSERRYMYGQRVVLLLVVEEGGRRIGRRGR